MKCSCGADLPAGAKFCSQCGRVVSETQEKRFCQYCGSALYPGSAFCGKCGKRVIVVAAAVSAAPPVEDRQPKKKKVPKGTCPSCGAVLYPGAAFCGKCRTPVPPSSSPAAPSAPMASSSALGGIRKSVRPLQTWAESKISNRKRAKQILIILLVIGLCMTSTGLCGRAIFGKVVNEVKRSPLIAGSSSPVAMMLNNIKNRLAIKLIVSVIRNDPSGFVKASEEIAHTVGGIAGMGSGYTDVVGWIAGQSALEAFTETRESVKNSAGGYWVLLVIMAYYKEFLIIGIILAVSAALLWFLLGGSFRDFKALKLMPAAWVGGSWITIMLALGIFAFIRISGMAHNLMGGI